MGSVDAAFPDRQRPVRLLSQSLDP
jgi:hypothetical protein